MVTLKPVTFSKRFIVCQLLCVVIWAVESRAVQGEPSSAMSPTSQTNDAPRFALAIHGGAGTINRDSMTSDKEKEYRRGLEQSLEAGAAILRAGGTSLDAVEACVRVLEDHPLFNAGRGAVFTSAGTNEMDAAIMEGQSLKAGAVVSVKHIRNPIALA